MKLRPYQEEDVEVLKQNPSYGVFNEQRTGKTPTTLKALEAHNAKKTLIVCPASAVLQWQEEYEKWLGQWCDTLTGTKQKKEQIIKGWSHGLVCSHRALINKNYLEAILKAKPDAVVIDEAHRMKNPNTATAKAIFKFKNVKIKYALTGTPAPNKPHEVWAILHWLEPKVFPSYWRFIENYFITILQHMKGQTFKEVRGFKPGMYKVFSRILSKMCIQRKRKEVMPWLPEKDRSRINLTPTPKQRKYLMELKKYYETEHIMTEGVLDTLIRYRQICLHPTLIGLKGTSPKLDWLLEYVKDYPERPTIIFSKFTSFIKLLSKELKDTPHGVIIGSTPLKQRNDLKLAFQKGEVKLLIINIDAGKEALTLDTAECTIFTDKYPPANDILQAEDRFVATTEEKASKPHFILELVMEGTYDEQLYDLVDLRINEVDVVNNYKKYMTGGQND